MLGAAGVLALAIAGVLAVPVADAEFPYLGSGTLAEPSSWKLPPGQVPGNLGGLRWKFAATPAIPSEHAGEEAAITKDNSQMDELCGVTGMSLVDQFATMPEGTGSCIAAGTPIHTAFAVTLGRPDVGIAELDSGIEWSNRSAALSLRAKYLLNAGELPAPHVDMASTFDPTTGVSCQTARAATGGDYDSRGGMPGGKPGGHGPIPYDVLEQGAFDVLDYACDARVAKVVTTFPRCSNPPTTSECRNGPAGVLTPEDLIIAFSDGVDHDRDGYASDIAGWNFVDDNNDPYDEVHYGHGTGEEEDSAAEANNPAGEFGTCPDCEVMELRVGESFITDGNRFAEAVNYATDRGVDVIQEPLGTYNDPVFAREAIEYAYRHGVAVIASAADEAAEHHNQPGALPDTIVVNAVEGPASIEGVGATTLPPSYLQLDGCTNFGTRVDVSVPATSCSSEATGKSAGVAALIYSAALDACGAPLYGKCSKHDGTRLTAAAGCKRVNKQPCPITANEVRQLMASGNIEGTSVDGSSKLGSQAPSSGAASADEGQGGQADDVDTALEPETSCGVGLPTCTDPNLNTLFAADEDGGLVGPLPDTFRYPSRRGWDEFFGYGRIDAYKSVDAAAEGWIPPEADITSPEWFQQISPQEPSLAVEGHVGARTAYTCRVEVAPGAQPNNRASGGDFAAAEAAFCDGTTVHTGSFDGTLATLSTSKLEAQFPKTNPAGFEGNENGGGANGQSANGRPNTQPYAFTLRVVVRTAPGAQGPVMTGEDRRQLNLHRDAQMAKGFPLEMKTDGDASPLLVDLAGNDRNQLVVANSDGFIDAYEYDPASGSLSELPGWPVHTDPLPLHKEASYKGRSGEARIHYAPIIEAPAAGDLTGDGETDIVAGDLAGNIYAWNAQGKLIFHRTSDPRYTGAPLAGAPSWEAQRAGVRERTEAGFASSPVLADLEPENGSGLDIIAAATDRHLYAWHADGSAVSGFPVMIADPSKLASVDPVSNEPRFNSGVPADENKDEDQGKLVDTPAVASLDGPEEPPTIIVGSNEEYLTNTGSEGAINAGDLTTTSLGAIGQSGLLSFANGRVYAVKATGCSSDPSSCATGGIVCQSESCHSVAYREGWPAKIGIIDAGLLPEVGEGIDGSPVVAPMKCPSGGEGPKIAVTPDAGPGYVLNPDGSSCYGETGGADNALETDASASATKVDTPAFPTVGEPAFGTLNGRTVNLFAPAAGLLRALDVVAPDYQKGGQDFIASWSAETGQFAPGYPAASNDLSFITGEAVGDITGEAPKQEVVAGTAENDLEAYNELGLPASSSWPKLTGGWTVATPVLGSLGTVDTDGEAKKDVVSITREGTIAVYSTPAAACSPSSWPSFHHDLANSGDYTRDAVAPGVPLSASASGGVLKWTAPGDDLMCGKAARYEIVTSNKKITPQTFSSATPLEGAPEPAAAGTSQSYALPAGAKSYVAIRAVGDQGNVGLPAVVTP